MVHGLNSTKGTKPWRMLMCKYTWGEHTCQHHPQRNWNFIVEYRFLLFWFSLNTKFGYRKNGFLRAVFFSLQQEEKKVPLLFYSTFLSWWWIEMADRPPIYLYLIFEISISQNLFLNLIFELDFFSISNWIFTGYTGSKNQVWNRQKINFKNQV